MLIRKDRYCSTCDNMLQTFIYKYIKETDTMEMVCLGCLKFAAREMAKNIYPDIVMDIKNYDDESFDLARRLVT